MKCVHCDEAACGVCAMCKEHMINMPDILSIYVGQANMSNAVVVADALFCGVCKPQPEPIEMPELY